MNKKIFNLELLVLRNEILEEFCLDLNNNILKKIRKNTKAYKELELFIESLDTKKISLENEINLFINTNKDNYSSIKMKTEILESLIKLKNELNIDAISELLELFVINYWELVFEEKLVQISPIKLDMSIMISLNKTNLYISQSKDIKENIIYKIDDLIIKDNKEYLKINELKKYIIGLDTFLISKKCTLSDIDNINLAMSPLN